MTNKQEIPKGFMNWFKSHFIDKDKIDVWAFYDRKLSIQENKNIFEDKFANLFIEGKTELKSKMQEAKEQLKIAEFEKQKHYFEKAFGIEIKFIGGKNGIQ